MTESQIFNLGIILAVVGTLILLACLLYTSDAADEL